MSESPSNALAGGRLNARDARVLLLWVLAAVLGAFVAFRYYFAAFPEASVDFKVSRSEAFANARAFVTAQGQRLDGYQSTIVFDVDDTAKTYLEREVGLEQANRLMASEVNVWRWEARFFRPGQKEEFRAQVNPAGRLVGYEHVIEEARSGARLDQDAARAIAERFLRGPYALDLAAYDFLPGEASSTDRPNRLDWSFTWERRGFRAPNNANGAPYRVRATVQGDAVGGAEQFLRVPEAWQRDFAKLRSTNIVYLWIDQAVLVFLLGALFWTLYDLARRGMAWWGGAWKLGVVVAVLFFATNVNNWPLTRAGYDTNSSYPGFIVLQMGLALLGGLGAGLFVALAVAAAEPIYRLKQPEMLRLGKAFTLPGMRTKQFFRSCVIGLSLAAAHIGFVVLFYLVGRRFGVWAPQDLNYTDVVSTSLPWLYPLTIGIFASTSEEFLFRLFAIPVVHRFTGSKFLAVVLPAFIWGFGHSAYPQEPGYIRGIEVGLIGIVAGIVMLRWGILATLMWHYTVDALLISLFLLRSANKYFRVSGAIVGAAVLIPLGFAGVSYLVRRRFEPEEPLENRAEPLVESAPAAAAAPAPAAVPFAGVSRRTLGFALACGALGAVLVLAVKQPAIGDFVRFQIDAKQAAAQADNVMRKMKLDPATWHRAVVFIDNFDRPTDPGNSDYSNEYTNEYLRRKVGIAAANRLYQEKVPSALWRVRYFRDSQKEEYAVVIRADGQLHGVHHEIEEKAPGANLNKQEAQARAETYLREEKKVDLSQWKLVEAKSEQNPAHTRTDHTFVWEELAGVADAHVRMVVRVQGDEVSGYRVFIKVPESWQRQQTESTLGSIVHLVGEWVLLLAFGVVAIVIFFKNLKHPDVAGIPWRRLARWALWGLVAVGVAYANSTAAILAQYSTDMPLKTFLGITVIGLLIVIGAVYAFLVLLFVLGWFFLSRAFGREQIPSWRGMSAEYYRDAFWLSLAGGGVLAGLGRVGMLVSRVWPTAAHGLSASLPGNLVDVTLPGAQAIAGAISRGLYTAAIVAVVAGFFAAYLRAAWMRAGLAVLAALALTSDWGSPADFAKRFLLNLLLIGVLWLGVTRVVRFNLLAYFLIGATGVLAGAAVQLLQQPNAFYRANGVAVVAVLLGLLAWPLVAARGAGNAAHTR